MALPPARGCRTRDSLRTRSVSVSAAAWVPVTVPRRFKFPAPGPLTELLAGCAGPARPGGLPGPEALPSVHTSHDKYSYDENRMAERLQRWTLEAPGMKAAISSLPVTLPLGADAARECAVSIAKLPAKRHESRV